MNGKRKTTCRLGKTGPVLLVCVLIFGCQFYCRAQLPDSDFVAVKAAAEAGDPAAQDKLAGEFVHHGHFLPAELWYRKAADQGYVDAHAKLGEMLLTHAGLPAGLKPDISAAIDSEAIKWLTLAANASNTLAQAELARAYLNGQLVKADPLEAYKWGDLAANAPPSVPGSIGGRSVRDMAIQKMSFDQIAQAKLRVVTFYSRGVTPEKPDPAWVKEIKLTGVSGPISARLAIINNHTLGVGDSSFLKIAGMVIQVHCLGVQDDSALVQIAGLDKPKVLILEDDTIKN